jgi:hypothetical protein
MDIQELEKFCNYAKVANPPFNPSEAILCLIDKIHWLERRISSMELEKEPYED